MVVLVEVWGVVVGELYLSVLEKRVLDFEHDCLLFSAEKEAQIVANFGFSATRYYQVLNILLDSVVALEYSPILVARLRQARSRGRSMRLVQCFNG